MLPAEYPQVVHKQSPRNYTEVVTNFRAIPGLIHTWSGMETVFSTPRPHSYPQPCLLERAFGIRLALIHERRPSWQMSEQGSQRPTCR